MTLTEVSDIVTTFAELSMSSSPPAEGGAHAQSIDWLLVFSLFSNAILFFGLLIWKAAPLVSTSLRQRRAEMATNLEEAQSKQNAAEARLGEYQEKLDNLEREVARVVASYEKEAEADRVRLEEETEKAIARLERETNLTISQEMRKATAAIHASAVEATLRTAEDKIRNRIDDSDHNRLTEQYISSLNGSSV